MYVWDIWTGLVLDKINPSMWCSVLEFYWLFNDFLFVFVNMLILHWVLSLYFSVFKWNGIQTDALLSRCMLGIPAIKSSYIRTFTALLTELKLFASIWLTKVCYFVLLSSEKLLKDWYLFISFDLRDAVYEYRLLLVKFRKYFKGPFRKTFSISKVTLIVFPIGRPSETTLLSDQTGSSLDQ